MHLPYMMHVVVWCGLWAWLFTGHDQAELVLALLCCAVVCCPAASAFLTAAAAGSDGSPPAFHVVGGQWSDKE